MGKGRHSLCGAHLLRELQALIDQDRQWAKAMHEYLMEAYRTTQHGPIPTDQQPHWRSRYQQICQQAVQEEHPLSALSNRMAAWAEPKGQLDVTYYSA